MADDDRIMAQLMRMTLRFDAMDAQFNAMDARFDELRGEMQAGFAAQTAQLGALRANLLVKMDRFENRLNDLALNDLATTGEHVSVVETVAHTRRELATLSEIQAVMQQQIKRLQARFDETDLSKPGPGEGP